MEQNSTLFSYLDCEKTSAQYKSVKFKIAEKNRDGSYRWRCCVCSATITVKNDVVIKNNNETHKSTKCTNMIPVEIECIR